jgi:hypothetical protein
MTPYRVDFYYPLKLPLMDMSFKQNKTVETNSLKYARQTAKYGSTGAFALLYKVLHNGERPVYVLLGVWANNRKISKRM